MRITVDLNKCNDHGQCVFSAGRGQPRRRRQAVVPARGAETYMSGELDESLRDDVEEAADVCPLQAITVD